MDFPENFYCHALNLLPQLSPVRTAQLVKRFGSARKVYFASQTELKEAGLEPDLAKVVASHTHSIDLAREIASLEREHISLLGRSDPGYPALLNEIAAPPQLLYYKGSMRDSDDLCVAVVGTRKITGYGRAAITYLIEPLVHAGVTIVSGLAYGVDSEVQRIAAKNGRRTVAVLGGGLDAASFYPKEHQYLADEIIAAGGAIMSEYPPGMPPLRHHFIARNRIISGMSTATAVVECDVKSGSLITARFALEQDRTVYAVPGPIYSPQSQGPNNLLKMGARPLTSADDIFEDLNLNTLPDQRSVQDMFGDSPAESALLKVITRQPTNINEIIKQSGLSPADATSALTFLEMKGRIRNLGGQQYILSR